jgi:hypothetical protein
LKKVSLRVFILNENTESNQNLNNDNQMIEFATTVANIHCHVTLLLLFKLVFIWWLGVKKTKQRNKMMMMMMMMTCMTMMCMMMMD